MFIVMKRAVGALYVQAISTICLDKKTASHKISQNYDKISQQLIKLVSGSVQIAIVRRNGRCLCLNGN